MTSIQSGSSPQPGLSRRRFLAWSAAVLAAPTAVGTLAACSPATKSAKKDGPLRVAWKTDIDTLNPLTSVTTEALEVLQLMYDKLLEYDADLKPEPGLATKSEISADGRTITYTLRAGAKWHDGQAVTSDDVVYTFNLIHKNNLSQYAQFLTDLKSVTAAGATTVVASFAGPQAFDPGIVVPILPKHIWSTMTPTAIQKYDNAKPVGSGPYTFGSWKKGQTVTVNRNDKWWGSKPAPASITWQLYSNDDVMAQGLRNGDVDILLQVPPTVYDGLKGAKGVAAISMPSFSFHHIGINVSAAEKSKGNPLLRQKAVRQALSCAVSRNQLVQLALAGHGVPGSVILPAAFGEWQYKPTADEILDNNPAKADALLDAAGFSARGADGVRRSSDGKPLSFRLIAIQDTSVDVRAAQLFQQAAEKVGINLKLTTLDANTLSSTVYNATDPDWDIFVWGWDSAVNDPDYLLGVPLTSQIGSNNDVFYSNPTYDALYSSQSAETDGTKRLDLVHQMQRLYYQDCAYLVMWYQDKLQAYRTTSWTGWKQTPGGTIFNFTRDNYLHVTSA